MNKKPKPLLSLSIVVDGDEINGRWQEVRCNIKLYREDDGLIWRLDGHLGDECEALPRPATLEKAKADARAVYRRGDPWFPRASWL